MEGKPKDPRVVAEFKKRRARQWMAVPVFIAAMIPLIMLNDLGPEGLFGLSKTLLASICVPILAAGIVFSLANWRCPACSSYLGKAISPKFCHKCGARLQE